MTRPPAVQIRERASAVCINADRMLTVYLEDPATGFVRPFLPGGGIEPGESPVDAVIRETLEETGYAVLPDAESVRVLTYDFVWANVHVPCRTHFFQVRLRHEFAIPSGISDAPYHRGCLWMPLADVGRQFGYHQAIHGIIMGFLNK